MSYDIRNLINYSPSPFQRPYATTQQVICDIDKTYLETQTDSFLDLAKAALEKPKDKKTVLDANRYLEALLWSGDEKKKRKGLLPPFPKSLHFVSASPPQMRSTLEAKFLMDRLCWSSITLKNQLYNIKKIKFHLLREQFSFKTLALFNLFDQNPGCEFFLIGDNAESDPYIYLGIKFFKEGALSHKGYLEFLKMAGLTRESIRTVAQSKGFLKPAKIKSIFIRDLVSKNKPLLDRYITKFSSYKNLFLKSFRSGFISGDMFAKTLHHLYGSLPPREDSVAASLHGDLLESGFNLEQANELTLLFLQGDDKAEGFTRVTSETEKVFYPDEDQFLSKMSTWFEQSQESP